MMNRTAVFLLLFLPAVATAQVQNLDTSISGVVRISGTRNGARIQGSGFVIGLDRDRATIVTASHVIEGAQFEVVFAADPTHHFPSDAVLGMDAGSPNGLAVFQVRGSLPGAVSTLDFEVQNRPRQGDELFLVGFPENFLAPLTPRRVLSGRRGTLLLIDQEIGEGFSGGPVIQNCKVVGIVTETGDQITYAVSAVVAHEALEGWGTKFGVLNKDHLTPSSTSTLHSPPAEGLRAKVPVAKCVPGEKRTENGIDYVRICPGTFTMGSAANDTQADDDEKPAHQVTLSEEYWLGQTEVTNAQYTDHKREDRLPAVDISWTEAQAACERFGGRLPTEAEWEYAARAGSTTAWSFSGTETSLGDYAWYAKNAGDTAHPVAMNKPNAWGLYDMNGNVWEWVANWYAPYTAAAQRDPTGPETGTERVLRGGAFDAPPRYLRSAVRVGGQPGIRFGFFGFRCALSPRRQP